eukprot:364980-Chlamydomonas_euryale.AAC.7
MGPMTMENMVATTRNPAHTCCVMAGMTGVSVSADSTITMMNDCGMETRPGRGMVRIRWGSGGGKARATLGQVGVWSGSSWGQVGTRSGPGWGKAGAWSGPG